MCVYVIMYIYIYMHTYIDTYLYIYVRLYTQTHTYHLCGLVVDVVARAHVAGDAGQVRYARGLRKRGSMEVGLYTILHCQYCIVYGLRKGGRGGRMLRNRRTIVMHYCGQCKWGEAIQG